MSIVGVPRRYWKKKISHFARKRWVNQVPAASGSCGSGGRKRSIDLVFHKADAAFVFYELKTTPKSGNVFDAAIELLSYGLLYVYSRTSTAAYKGRRLMKASEAHLRVLGTADYYSQQTVDTGLLKKLQDAISNSLNDLASTHLPGCKLDFGFDIFPDEFKWFVKDQEDRSKILNALGGIHPLISY